MKPYETYEIEDDFESFTQKLIAEAKENQIPLNENVTQTKHMVKSDLRDVIPPQLYALIGQINEAIERSAESLGRNVSYKNHEK